MRIKNFHLIIIALVVVLSSCGSPVYKENKVIDTAGWHKDSVLVFETDSLVELPEKISLGFEMRNTIDYPYRNFWSFVSITFPNGSVRLDTIYHVLMTREGFWEEYVSGSGAIKTSSVYYKYRVVDPAPGKYIIAVQHGMREEYLQEVISISGFIEEFVEE